MKKKQLNVYNFDFGTITEEKNHIKMEMDRNQFTHDHLDDLKVNIEEEHFLQLYDRKESEDVLTFYYEKTDELTNLNKIRQEKKPVKISIAEQILEEDILGTYDKEQLFISLNPSTMYYYPMKTIKYMYVANKYMPKKNYTNLERYKSCIVSILTNIPYQKCLDDKEEVKQETNELIQEIYNQTNRQDLLHFIKNSESYITYHYISNHREKEKKHRRNYQFALASVVIIGLMLVTFTEINASNKQEALANDYEQQLENKDTLFEANQEFQSGNYEQAVQLYEEGNADSEQVANDLVEEGQYQLAINTNENVLETTIQHAYSNDNQNQIAELDNSQLSDNGKTKLENEIAIINGDSSEMANVLNFLEDENTAERLTRKLIEQNNLAQAQQVQDQYPDNQTISQLVQQGQTQQEISDIQDEIDSLNSEKDGLDEDDDSDQIDDIDNQIDDLNSQLDSLQNNNEENNSDNNGDSNES